MLKDIGGKKMYWENVNNGNFSQLMRWMSTQKKMEKHGTLWMTNNA